jgi:phosphatidylglycerophosphate synthase
MSPFGALVDQICDHTRESLVIAAVAVQGALHPVPAVLYPLVYTLFNFLLFLCNREDVPVPWAIKSYLIVYPALFLYTCFGVGWLTPAVALSEALMVVTILIALHNLRQRLGGGTTAPSPPGSP